VGSARAAKVASRWASFAIAIRLYNQAVILSMI
jgi:hypothetical protein